MRIMYFFAQYRSAMYMWQNDHIIDELKRHSIDVEIFNPLLYESFDKANEEACKIISVGEYDLFMTCETDEVCYVHTIEQAKRKGIPTLLYCFDSLMTPLNHRKIAPHVDAVMISQKDNTGVFKSYNSNTIVSHYAANPFFFKFGNAGGEKLRICFPGTVYGSRNTVIKKLVDAGIDISLFFGKASTDRQLKSDIAGNLPTAPIQRSSPLQVAGRLLRYNEGRKVLAGALLSALKKAEPINFESPNIQISPAVDLKQTNEIYAKHALSLSISIGRNTGVLKNPIQIVHLRNFEIPMSGGVQFCQYYDELSECFEENKEIIFYRTEDEMIDKARFYLRPDQENVRNSIRIAARRRSEMEHTWFCRFSKAFDALGLKY